MNKPCGACYWGARPTEGWMFTTTYMSGASWNDTFWEHETFNKLDLKGRAETDNDKWRAIHYEIQKSLSTKVVSCAPCSLTMSLL